MLKLTQKDYTDHIEKRRAELIDAWESDKRVKALKTAIKVFPITSLFGNLMFFILCI